MTYVGILLTYISNIPLKKKKRYDIGIL